MGSPHVRGQNTDKGMRASANRSGFATGSGRSSLARRRDSARYSAAYCRGSSPPQECRMQMWRSTVFASRRLPRHASGRVALTSEWIRKANATADMTMSGCTALSPWRGPAFGGGRPRPTTIFPRRAGAAVPGRAGEARPALRRARSLATAGGLTSGMDLALASSNATSNSLWPSPPPTTWNTRAPAAIAAGGAYRHLTRHQTSDYH
jgi:hypothetical protein